MRPILFAFVLLASTAPALAKPRPPVEDQPMWMTDPQALKLDIVKRFLDRGETGSALALIAAMRQEDIDVPDLDLLQGIALRDQGMSSEAERLLLEAQKKMGRDPRPYAELCILYGAVARVDDAIVACTRATELDPEESKSWNNLSYVLLGAGRGADALSAAQQAVDLDGSQSRYKNNLGFALGANERWNDAWDTFRSVGSEADAWFNLGIAYDHAGREQDARASWLRALASEPAYAAAHVALKKLETEPVAAPIAAPSNPEGASP